MIIFKTFLIFLSTTFSINKDDFQVKISQSKKSIILMNTSNSELISCPDPYNISYLRAVCHRPSDFLLICKNSCSMNALENISYINISCYDDLSYSWFCFFTNKDDESIELSNSTIRKLLRNSDASKFFGWILF